MGRGKLSMKFIMKDKVRISTYEKRKKGLIKKAEELTILCSVETCVIVYMPKSKDTPPKLEIWPPDHAQLINLINKYKAKPSHARERKCFNVLDFFATRRKKLDDDISKLRKANIEAKFSTWDDRINNFSVNQLSALLARLDSNIESAKKRIDMIKGKHQSLIEDSKSMMFHVPSCHPFSSSNEVVQFQPLNLDPIDHNHMSMVLSTNGTLDFTRVDGECSSSITHRSVSPQTCYDLAGPMIDNVMLNNPWGVPISLYGQYMQSMTPFVQPAMSSFPSQFGDLYNNVGDRNESMNKKQRF